MIKFYKLSDTCNAKQGKAYPLNLNTLKPTKNEI